MWGALLGLLLLLGNIPAIVIVFVCAFVGRYPWWLLTPDDPTSPFGQYEEAVRKVYAWPLIGRWAGDFYWLAFRNCLYGLAYRLKPYRFKGITVYSDLPVKVARWRRLTLWNAAGYRQLTVRLFGRYAMAAGWKVDRVVLDPNTKRAAVNMDFRPTFTVRANLDL